MTYQVNRYLRDLLRSIFDHQLISDTPHGLDQTVFEFLAQMMDMDLNCIAFDPFIPAVEYLFQIISGEHVTGFVNKLGEQDIGEALIKTGWALAYRKYSTKYVGAEQEAKKAHRGLWQR